MVVFLPVVPSGVVTPACVTNTPPLLHPGTESQRPLAHECLGEVLRVLRQVINMYPLLNTVEILTAAGKLISKVKGQSAARAHVFRDDVRVFCRVFMEEMEMRF